MAIVILTREVEQSELDSQILDNAILWFTCEDLPSTLPFFIYNDSKTLHLQSKWEKVDVSNGCEYLFLRVEHVVRLEAKTAGTAIHLKDNESLRSKLPITIFADILKEEQFYLANPQHLINLRFTERLTQKQAYVTLSNHDQIPVSAEAEQQLIKILKDCTII